MKYAVIEINRNQYRVEEGQEIFVDRLKDKKIDPDVLLFVDKSKVKIGKPVVKGVKVKIKILEDIVKGKKIHVQTFKAKSRYRRKIGFRPLYTKLLIEKISS